ncbi:MAG: putative Ig domain-containing protein [Myxococcaceae bacterium]
MKTLNPLLSARAALSLAALAVTLSVTLSTSALAQVPTVIVSSQPYQPLVGASTLTFSDGDDEGILVPLGFTFPYFGQNYTHAVIDSNGFLMLAVASTSSPCVGAFSSCYTNASLPSTSAPSTAAPMIAGFWDDMDVGTSGAGTVRTLSQAGVFSAEWVGIQRYTSTGATVTFTIRLEASGAFTIHYGSITTASAFSASAGFQNATGTLGANVIPGCTTTCGTVGFVPNMYVRVGEPNEADLAVTSVTIANFVMQGNGNLNFDVSAALRNFGRTPANNVVWRAYLSRDQALDLTPTDGGADIQVAQGGPVNFPAVDGGFTSDGGLAIVNVTGPAATTTAPPTGEYYVLVEVDSTNVVMEASETNNVGSTATAFVQGIDLVATSITGPATSGGGNVENFPVSFFNRGTTAAGSVNLRLLLSADQVLDQSDFPIYSTSRMVSGGQTITETLSVTMPANVPNGQFYYLLEIDPGNMVVEANETNNVVSSSAKVDVKRADLLAEQVTFLDPVTGLETTNARFGEAARMKVRFRNTGGANANNFRVALVLSTDTSLSLLSDNYVCDQVVAQTVPSTTSTEVTLDCTLPLRNAAMMAYGTGPYFLFGVVDATGAVFESNKANNSLMVGPVRVSAPGADLAVTTVTAPASAGVGEIIPVVRTLRNLGNVDGTAVPYRFYASANDIITTDDVLLQIIDNSGPHDEGTVTLARGAGNTATELVRLPGTMAAGNYYIGCIIDPAFTTPNDLDPTNNAGASVAMAIAPSSLRVVNTALPDAVIGRPYNFRLSAVGEQGASTWSIDTSQGAPAWLTIGASDGLLSGTPSGTGGAQVAALTVVLDNGGRQAAVRLALRVLPTTSPVEITTTSLPAVVNSPTSQYQFMLGAAGGVSPYTWRITGGTLPSGMSLAADGTLAGAPRNATTGNTPLTVEVRDAVGGRAQKQLTLRLIAAGAITFTTVSIPDALTGQDYLQDIAVANQDGSMLAKPLRWLVTGDVPGGLAVTPQAELITVGGRPTQAGTFSFTISVEDNNGRADSLAFTMTVHPPRYRVIGSMPEVLRPGDIVAIQLTASPASTTVGFRVASGTLPRGITLDPSGLLAGSLEKDGVEGLWPFVVEAKDPSGMSGLTPFALRIERDVRPGCSSTGSSPLFVLATLALLAFMRRSRGVKVSAVALVAAVLVAPGLARAQYQVVGPTPATYTPLTNGAVTTAGASLTVPFQVPFFDTTFNAVAMSTYGYLAIGGSYSSASSNLGIPHTSTSTLVPQMYIAPWWDALTSATSYRYQVTGLAPNRIMAFEWNGAGANLTSTRISFQVLLYETTGRIRFVYSTALPGTVSSSVGVQKATSVGIAGMSCASTGACTSAQFPAGQAIDFFLPPDLEIAALSAPQLGYAGVAFPVTATVRNRGGRDATQVSVRFFLSTDATLDVMNDTIIGTAPAITVPAQGVAQATLNAPLPANLTGSNYYVFAVVDPDRTIVEQSEVNNDSSPSAVAIGPPTADLVVNAFTAPTTAMPGATLQVSRTFVNVGNAASAAGKFSYFLSDNSSVSIADRALSVGSLASLMPQAVDMGMDMVTLPPTLAPGVYWLGVCVNYDSGTSQFGGSEITIVNNCFTQTASVQVSTSAVTVSTAALPMATQYAPYGLRLLATGGTGTYTWELASGTLPPGLTLSTAGDVVGTPSQPGNFSFDAKVTSGTLTDQRSLSISVATGGLPLVIVDQTLTAAEFGRAYSAALVAVGGKPPYTWRALDADTLPPGVGVAADGLLEGRPVASGDFTFAVEVKDQDGTTVSKELAVRVVTPTSLSIATSAVEAASLGREYLQPLVAVGGTAPYAWTLIRFQQLPESITDAPGPVLFNNGIPISFPPDFGIDIDDRDTSDYLSGTPRKAGLYALTLKVKDGADTEDTASVLLRVTYRDGLAITTLQLPDAFVNQPYQVRLSHNGGSDAVGVAFSTPCVEQAVRPGEFQCAATQPLERMPVGLNLGADGSIFGTPNADTGTYTFLVKVSDASGRQDVRALALRLRPDFALDRSSCSSTGLEPSLITLALAAFLARRRRR